MCENPVLCPHCGTPVICDVHTYIKFVKKNIEVHKRGVDIITELDEAAESLPIMHSDDIVSAVDSMETLLNQEMLYTVSTIS